MTQQQLPAPLLPTSVDLRGYLVSFLAAMEGATARRCCISLAFEDGSRQLAVEVGVGDNARAVYLLEGDLAKPIDVLVPECVTVLDLSSRRRPLT